MLLKTFGAVFAILTFAAAFAFTGSAAVVYVLEHLE